MNDPIAESAQESITDLIGQSSLGVAGARQLRSRVPDRVAEEIRSRSRTGEAAATCRQAGLQAGSRSVQVNYYYYAQQTWTAKPARLSVPACPYRGLSVFEEGDQEFFFGRERAITEVMERLSEDADNGFLVISGESGAGKSSLLRAGVLPQLRRDGLAGEPAARAWPCLLFTPGARPLIELAARVAALAGLDVTETARALATDPAGFGLLARQAVLARGPSADARSPAGRQRLILIIDQFEQVFTQCSDESERRAFITALHSATFDATAFSGPSALVVLGVRADFEARCAEYPELTEAIQRRYLLTAMTTRQLQLAITEPAKRAGTHVEPALTDYLLQEVPSHQPCSTAASTAVSTRSGAGVLPLLSYALSETWRARTGDSLTLADYQRTGGIEAAVATAAQRAYDSLTLAQQDTARQVFLQLTAASADDTDVTVPAAHAELAAGKNARDVRAVLEAFSRERLLTLTTDGAEITHDVLLTAWPLLRDTWLAETRAARESRAKLRVAAHDWARHGNDRAYLWRGSVLASASAIRAGTASGRLPPLSPDEQLFLTASTRQARRGRLMRQALCVLPVVIIAVFAVVSIILNIQQRADARQALQRAATARQLANESIALRSTDPSLAGLMSVAAYRVNPSADTRYSMLAAAITTGRRATILPSTLDQVHAVAFSPDGEMIAAAVNTDNYQGEIQIRNTSTGHIIVILSVDASFQVDVSGTLNFSPNGTILAAGTSDGAVRLWRVDDWRLQATLPSCRGFTDPVLTLNFKPDGTSLAVGTWPVHSTEDGCLRLWDLASPSHPALHSQWPVNEATSLAFSPNGTALAAGTTTGVQLRDAASGRLTSTLPAGPVSSLAFSPDDNTLAVGTPNSVQLWDVSSMRPAGAAIPSTTIVGDLAISPDGNILAVATSKGTQLWDIATREHIGTPLIPASGNASVAFSPDGTRLAIGTSHQGTNLWDIGFLLPSRTPAYLCQQIGLTLTRQQWAQYAPGIPYQDVCDTYLPLCALPQAPGQI